MISSDHIRAASSVLRNAEPYMTLLTKQRIKLERRSHVYVLLRCARGGAFYFC
jgi:hypothetical protein